MALGDELVTNGTFDTDLTGWTLLGPPGNVVWAAPGVVSIINAGGALNRSVILVPGTTYLLSVDIVSAEVDVSVGINNITPAQIVTSEVGHHEIEIVSNEVGLIAIGASGAAKVDNVSVREIIPDVGSGLDFDLGAKDVWEF